MTAFTESIVERAALAWLESVDWQARNGAEIASGEPAAEYDDYEQVILAERLHESLLPLVCVEPRLMDAEKFVGRAL